MVEISSWYHHQADRTICDTSSFVFQLTYSILSMCRLKQHLQEWCSKENICKRFLIRLNNKKKKIVVPFSFFYIIKYFWHFLIYSLSKVVEKNDHKYLYITYKYCIPHFFQTRGKNSIIYIPLYKRPAKTVRNTNLAQKAISNMQQMCCDLAESFESREHWLWDITRKENEFLFFIA